MELSPAVERAQADVERSARDRGDVHPSLSDWFTVLLADDEGRPAQLLLQLQLDPLFAAAYAHEQSTHHRHAPTTSLLLNRGRDLASLLRGDPTLTTDALFLAVVESAETVDGGFAALGASLQRLADAFGGKDNTPAAAEPPPQRLPATIIDPTSSSISHEFRIADPFETAQLHRILDATLNRAREAVRVVDDYARFGLNDRVLTDELKRVRHDLAEAESLIPELNRLRYRDTVGDVGTTLGTSREYHRSSPRETAGVNFKRLQEALRSIEEYGKQLGAEFGRRIESIRYRVYTIEKATFSESSLVDRLHAAHLYVLLTGQQCVASLDWTIREAAAGGVAIFQLREKSLSDVDLLARARQIRAWTRETNTLFIVNDRPDIARLAEADGVHLGQDDLSVADARRILANDQLIGVSTHNPEQVRRAVLDGADYLGIGPVFPSSTKSFDEFPGLEFVRQASEMTVRPMFALGGIGVNNVHDVVRAGVNRVAVASAITTADDPQLAARLLRERLDRDL